MRWAVYALTLVRRCVFFFVSKEGQKKKDAVTSVLSKGRQKIGGVNVFLTEPREKIPAL
jgi:hypothetical protein